MILRFVIGWLLTFGVIFLRWICRIRLHDDPRPGLRRENTAYAYAILHGHQPGAVLAAEAGTAAMVSRSTDGDLLVPSLRVKGVQAVRGSTRGRVGTRGAARHWRCASTMQRGSR
jgi:lysophospholipid acyltransferase (LPLAT)-like uncharacterized protein